MKSAFQMRLKTRILLIAVLGAIVCLLSLQIRQQAIRSYREHRRGSMYSVWLTIANHCDAYKRLPPAIVVDADGTPMASWRLAALPFSSAGMKAPSAWSQIDRTLPWDDPVNEVVTGEETFLYCFSRDSRDRANGSLDTNVFAVTGPGTAFSMDGRNHLKNLPNDTVVLIEAFKSGIPWAAPGDLNATQFDGAHTICGGDSGFHVAFADGVVWCMRADVPSEILRKFFFVATAHEFDRDQELAPYRIE